MCGIIAYIGPKSASKILVDGLRQLEYRGYDAAGVAIVLDQGEAHLEKRVGQVSELAKALAEHGLETQGIAGIGHTRWSTVGRADSVVNAHPHTDTQERVFAVHNGNIHNYIDLKKMLIDAGAQFRSTTDSEVIPHLYTYLATKYPTATPLEVLQKLTSYLQGTYAIAILRKDAPNEILLARHEMPLVVGIGDHELYAASDATPMIGHVSHVIHLQNDEHVVLRRNGHDLPQERQQPLTQTVDEARLGAFSHYMIKELHDSAHIVPQALINMYLPEGTLSIPSLQEINWKEVTGIHLVGCGSAFYAASFGQSILQALTGIRTTAQLAHEFLAESTPLEKGVLVIGVSQSGTTYDTLEAIREAKKRGHKTLGIINTIGSTMSQECDATVYIQAGVELSVASTKAFSAQCLTLALVGLGIAQHLGIATTEHQTLMNAITTLPKILPATLASTHERIQTIADSMPAIEGMLFLGRGRMLPIAREGALKAQEICYIHAQAMAAPEIKHGPLALVSQTSPSVVLMPSGETFARNMVTVDEIVTRGGKLIAITDADGISETLYEKTKDVIVTPTTHPWLTPLTMTLVVQLLAYEMAILRGHNPDRPRHLAKSVTVE